MKKLSNRNRAQAELAFPPPEPGRGGKRAGAGRKRKDGVERRRGKLAKLDVGMPHGRRAGFRAMMPVHVTLKMAAHVYNLRSKRSFRVIARAFAMASVRFDSQIIQFSVQGDHIHCLVEASNSVLLAKTVQGLSIRIARGLNAMMGRTGRVFHDRYHAHILKTPTEVRHARHYIRNNFRNHAAARPNVTLSAFWVDPFSSDAPSMTFTLPPGRCWLLGAAAARKAQALAKSTVKPRDPQFQ